MVTTKPIQGSLTFLASRSSPAVYRPAQSGKDSTEGNYVTHNVPVYNGRQQFFEQDSSSSLDVEGFQLVTHQAHVQDFYNDNEMKSSYHDQVKKLLLSNIPGATRVEIFDDTRRSSSLSRQAEKQIRGPSSNVHGDYTAASGIKRLRDFFANDKQQAEELLQRRFCIVNVWRSISGRPVCDYHMVLCDSTTVSPDDCVSVERRSAQRIGEIQMLVFNPNQKWYYYPNMQMDEALLIKTFDSATDGRTRFNFHSSFQDPTATEGAPPRESIETRCFVLF